VTCVHHPRRAWTLVVKQMIDRFAFGSLDPTACACAVVRPVYAPVRDRVYSRFRDHVKLEFESNTVISCVAEADALTTRIASSDSHSGAFTSVPGAFPRLLWFRGPRL
jgi:hypothetical protein